MTQKNDNATDSRTDKAVVCDALVKTPLSVNTQGVAVMRSELPQDAQAHFNKFVDRAREHDYAKEPRIWSNIRITQDPKDGRVLLLRAFMRGGKVGLHARIYLRGTYGVLLS